MTSDSFELTQPMPNSLNKERPITLFLYKQVHEWLAVNVDLSHFTNADVAFATSIAIESLNRRGNTSIPSHGIDSEEDRSRARAVFSEVLGDIDDRRKTDRHFADDISAVVDDVLKRACGGMI